MITRRAKHLLLPLLALGLTLAIAASAQAMGRQEQGSGNPSVSLQINFGTTPHWEAVPGTSVMVIRQGDRSDYDMFRYGRDYYAYNHNDGRWYRSRNWRGRFLLIDERSLPGEFRRVPRQHWRYYPTAWEDRSYQGSGGTSASLQVSFGTRPRWMGVRGTRVEVISGGERPPYDVFRYGGTYYAYNDNRWYSSDRESGNFTMIDDRSVPSEFSRVPRQHWRNYPSAWQNQNQGRGQGRGQMDMPPGQMKDKGKRDQGR